MGPVGSFKKEKKSLKDLQKNAQLKIIIFYMKYFEKNKIEDEQFRITFEWKIYSYENDKWAAENCAMDLMKITSILDAFPDTSLFVFCEAIHTYIIFE